MSIMLLPVFGGVWITVNCATDWCRRPIKVYVPKGQSAEGELCSECKHDA